MAGKELVKPLICVVIRAREKRRVSEEANHGSATKRARKKYEGIRLGVSEKKQGDRDVATTQEELGCQVRNHLT